MLTTLYVKAASFMTSFKNDERGVTAIEYGLIAVAMAAVLGIVFGTGGGTVGAALQAVFDKIIAELA
ncbi:Flp family type IVb pilin [Vibrio sp. ZSDZ65]|uniref:Flp family type IVb pilin n=1 Tax=Vibrio qingdaonensis TaxID=2829491 RepID=A0A9X3CK74_9VIBR|nr:Flp family type IVb pilin [Vibrio qingdaonensis]MCW8344694.1 Flp family type IVb pilin [Vibrio qingdaonensis]